MAPRLPMGEQSLGEANTLIISTSLNILADRGISEEVVHQIFDEAFWNGAGKIVRSSVSKENIIFLMSLRSDMFRRDGNYELLFKCILNYWDIMRWISYHGSSERENFHISISITGEVYLKSDLHPKISKFDAAIRALWVNKIRLLIDVLGLIAAFIALYSFISGENKFSEIWKSSTEVVKSTN